MSRLAPTFAALRGSGRRALVPFLMAGDPTLDATARYLDCFAASGADLLEIGVPFSDPIADGPVNQRAAQRALEGGTTLSDVLDLVASVRSRLAQPIVLLSYFNPILRFGLEPFSRRAADVGVDGVVVPDLPPEEGDSLRAAAHQNGLDVIFLAAPTSTDERLARVAASSRGFIYCVSLTGVTGVRDDVGADAESLVARLRRYTDLPICVGFGVSTPHHARQVAAFADGVIVGSAIVSLIERGGTDVVATLAEFVQALRAGVDAGAAVAAAGLARRGTHER